VGGEAVNDTELLKLCALALRYGHSMREAIDTMTLSEMEEHADRVAAMTKRAHDELLKAHPEIESSLPSGGIKGLLYA